MLKSFSAKQAHRLTVLLFLLLGLNHSSSSQKIQISGFVTDRNSGEALVNAHIIEKYLRRGTLTNPYGFFSIEISEYLAHLEITYVGYKSLDLELHCKHDTTINILLESSNLFEEVEVYAKTSELHTINRSTGNIFLTGKELENIPGLFGEHDILKSLQLLPGIQQGREGTSGIFVRGGDRGQNLILLDGVPVYNVNHLWGVFSVFTPEAIKSVDVYKGGFPARYGGRLSSVLDIRMKEGSLNDTKYDLTIGTTAAKFLIEGPFKKGKSSYIISARRTYADLFLYPNKEAFCI